MHPHLVNLCLVSMFTFFLQNKFTCAISYAYCYIFFLLGWSATDALIPMAEMVSSAVFQYYEEKEETNTIRNLIREARDGTRQVGICS